MSETNFIAFLGTMAFFSTDIDPFKEPSKLQIQGSEANLRCQVLNKDAKNIADYTDWHPQHPNQAFRNEIKIAGHPLDGINSRQSLQCR